MQDKDPEMHEGIRRALGVAGAMAVPMATSALGAAGGLMAGGPLGGVAGYMAGKMAGTKASSVLFPQGTLDAMKKKMKKN